MLRCRPVWFFAAGILSISFSGLADQQVRYSKLNKSVIEARLDSYRGSNQQRGEMVLLISPLQQETEASDGPGEAAKRTLLLLLEELPLKKAAAVTAKIHDERKNVLYQWGLENKNKD